jgi:hypothetical protein
MGSVDRVRRLDLPADAAGNWLRARAGGATYASSFTEHYLLPVLYPAALTREIQWGLGVLVILVNVVIYAVALRRRVTVDPPRAPRYGAPSGGR